MTRLPGKLTAAGWGGTGASDSTPEQSLVDGVRAELRNVRSLLATGGEDDAHTALDRLTRQWGAIRSLHGHVGNVLRGSTLVTLARVHKRLGDSDEALGLFTKGRAMLEEASDAGTELEPLERLELALALAEAGDVPPALGEIESAAASGVDAAVLMCDLAGALDAHGHDDAALATLHAAVEAAPRADIVELLVDGLIEHDRQADAIDVLLMQAQRLSMDVRLAEAEATLDRILALDPDNVPALVGRGDVLRDAGRLDDARESLERALSLDPQAGPAYAYRGLVKLEADEYESAVEDLRRARDLDGDQLMLAVGEAIAWAALGDTGQALEAAQRGVGLAPANPAALTQLARAQREAGGSDSAVATARNAVEFGPEFAPAWLLLAELLSEASELEHAIAAARRAVDLAPLQAEPLARLGECLRLAERYADAVDPLQRAIDMSPAYAWAIGTLGQVRFALGEPVLAVDLFERALDLDPSLLWAWQGLAKGRVELGQIESAIEALDNVIATQPDIAGLHLARAWLLKNAGRPADAAVSARAALDLAPSADAWEALGASLIDSEDYEGALAAYDNALELAPGDVDSLLGRAYSLISLERPGDAVEPYRDAIDRAPENPVAVNGAAVTLAALGRLDEAFDVLAAGRQQGVARALVMASATYVAGQAPDPLAALAAIGQPFASTDAGLLLRGRLLGEAGRIEEALGDIDAALDGDPEWDRALLAKGQLLAQAGRPDDLRAVGDKLLACPWEVEDVVTEISRLLVDAGRQDDVIAKLRDVVASDPDAAWPRTLLAELLRRAGDSDAALELLDRAIELAPTPYAVGTRGQVLLALSREEEAVEDLQRALADDPSQLWALFDLARGLRSLKRDVDAVQAIDPYLRQDQPNPAVIGLRASICSDWAAYDEVVALTSPALDGAAQPDPWLLELRAGAWLELRRPERALADLHRAVAVQQADEEAFGARWSQRGVGDALVALGRREEAEKEFRESLAAVDELADYPDLLLKLMLQGWCQYRLGLFDEAVATLARALAIDPLFVPAQLDLALAVLCQGPVEAAANEYERGIELSEANEGGRALSTLRVGLRDLREAVASWPDAVTADGVAKIERDLEAALEAARSRYAGELERIVAGVGAAQAPVA